MNRRELLTLLPGLTAVASSQLNAQAPAAAPAMAKIEHPPYKVKNPNKALSPFTGMDRNGWLDCGRHILEGAFKHVKSFEEPMFLPKLPGPGYPANGNEKASQQQRSAAIFEAIARTFNVAAPLIQNDPDIVVGGMTLADYYKHHLLKLMTDEKCSYFIGKTSQYNWQVQQTCELGNMAMWCIVAPDAFWNLLNKEEKKQVAQCFKDWSETHTLSHNWRWFNVMMMTFLAINEYDFDQRLMENYVDDLLLHHAGDGWYRDTSYDYYTAHVFQLYGAVWCKHYGRENQPERAAIMDGIYQQFSNHYQQIFGRNGEVNMYGRSILYRLGASAGMSAACLGGLQSDGLSMGLSRRVASGALLQFLTHPDFFNQGIPSLGFYGPFPNAIQGYSCSASPYWMFLNFACLTLPEEHEFWSAKEEIGMWGDVKDTEDHTEFWDGPGMLVSMHGPNGTSEIRPSKVHNSDPNYSRLVYNTAFPWEATPGNLITSSAMSLSRGGSKRMLPKSTSLAGFRKNVLYRQAHYPGHLAPFVDMATIIIPGGEIRVERFRRLKACNLMLGHFAIPHLPNKPVKSEKKVDGKQSTILSIPGRQLAMTNYMGWDKINSRIASNLHPEAKGSSMLYAELDDDKIYGVGPTILISVLLHKTDDTEWKDDELQPISSVESLKPNGLMHMTGIKLTLKNKEVYEIDYQDIDGTNSTH